MITSQLPKLNPSINRKSFHESSFPAILECETPLQDPGHFLELLASSQARRLDDQRVSMSHFPGLRLSTSNPPCTPPTCSPDQAHPQGTDVLKTRQVHSGCKVLVLVVNLRVFLLPPQSRPLEQKHLKHPPCTVISRQTLSTPRATRSSSTCWSNAR